MSSRTHEDGRPAYPTTWQLRHDAQALAVRERLRAMGSDGVRVWRRGDLTVIVSRDPDRAERPGWHLSISADSERYPTWDEIADARYDLLPHRCTFAMLLPPPEEYVNAHSWTFHLHELPRGDR